MVERTRVAVVGGGISGLAAAHALHKAAVPFVLLEGSDRFGGVIRTDVVDGFLLEGGPDSILALKPHGVALCRELGLGDRLVPTNPSERTVYVLRGKVLHPLPEGMVLGVPTRFGPFLNSRLFSWAGKLRMGLELVWPAERSGEDESIASFMRRRLGREALERLGEPLLAGIHAGDPEKLSILATFPRFKELEQRSGSLIRGMWASPRPSEGATSAFCSLPGGLVELVQALVAALPSGSVRAGNPVASVLREDGEFRLEFVGGGSMRAPVVLLATPPGVSSGLLSVLEPEAARTLRSIPFASTATVLLGYRREDVQHPLNGYGLLVPRTEGLRTTALGFFSTKFPGRAPEGSVLLRGFVGGARDPDVLSLGDDEIADLVEAEMAPALRIRGSARLRRVYRWRASTPQLEVGHLDRMAEVDARIARIPGLFVTGAGIRVTGLPDCIADGSRAADGARSFLAAQAPEDRPLQPASSGGPPRPGPGALTD